MEIKKVNVPYHTLAAETQEAMVVADQSFLKGFQILGAQTLEAARPGGEMVAAGQSC
jgi:vacuolar-type H+-ATPase subunit F/Vma7